MNGVPFFAVPGLYDHFSDRLPDSYFVMIPSGIAFVLMIRGFIELYFLRGTKWTNRFGPNPLEGADTGTFRAGQAARDQRLEPGQRNRDDAAQSWPFAAFAC